MNILGWVLNWWRSWRGDLNPDSLEEIEIDLPSPSRCSHDDLFVADARVTQEDGMAIYVNLLLECRQCHDIWRVQHRINEVAQITGAGDRFLSPRELGLEVTGEGGVRKVDHTEETMRILREQRMPGFRQPYSPYQPPKKQKRRKPRRKR